MNIETQEQVWEIITQDMLNFGKYSKFNKDLFAENQISAYMQFNTYFDNFMADYKSNMTKLNEYNRIMIEMLNSNNYHVNNGQFIESAIEEDNISVLINNDNESYLLDYGGTYTYHENGKDYIATNNQIQQIINEQSIYGDDVEVNGTPYVYAGQQYAGKTKIQLNNGGIIYTNTPEKYIGKGSIISDSGVITTSTPTSYPVSSGKTNGSPTTVKYRVGNRGFPNLYQAKAYCSQNGYSESKIEAVTPQQTKTNTSTTRYYTVVGGQVKSYSTLYDAVAASGGEKEVHSYSPASSIGGGENTVYTSTNGKTKIQLSTGGYVYTDNPEKYTTTGKGKIVSASTGIEVGPIKYTGLAMLHGSELKPEYVLNSDQANTLINNMLLIPKFECIGKLRKVYRFNNGIIMNDVKDPEKLSCDILKSISNKNNKK